MELTPEDEALLRECSKDEAAYQQLRSLFAQRISQAEDLQRLYQSLFDQSNDAVFILDLSGNHIDVNQRAAVMCGYPREELRKLTYADLIVPEQITSAESVLERLMRGERVPPYERKFRHKDGTIYEVEINAECVFDAHDVPLYIQSIVRDIRERVQLVTALRNEDRQKQTIIKVMAEGLVFHQHDGKIIQVNPAAERILGLTQEQMMGLKSTDPRWHTIDENGNPFPGDTHPVMVTLKTGMPCYNIVMGVHKPDDTLTWISINSAPVFFDEEHDNKPDAVVVSFSDITRVKAAHEQELALELERQRMSLIQQFIQDISHEFRTPLSIINTGAYFVKRVEDRERHFQQADKILDQVSLLSKLVDTLLLMSRLHTNPDMSVAPVWLGNVLWQAAQSLEESRPSAAVTLEFVSVKKDFTVYADARMLMEAFQHVIANAIRYTLPGGHVTIKTTIHEDYVAVDIADTGIGMSAESLERAFVRFWRLDTAHTKPGFGLGLPIAQRILELHGGEIYLQSGLGSGTNAVIYLPLSGSTESA